MVTTALMRRPEDAASRGIVSGLTIEATADAEWLANVHLRTISIALGGVFPPDSPMPTNRDLIAIWEDRLGDTTASTFIAYRQTLVVGAVAVRISEPARCTSIEAGN